MGRQMGTCEGTDLDEGTAGNPCGGGQDASSSRLDLARDVSINKQSVRSCAACAGARALVGVCADARVRVFG
eukprot:938951-Pleurochrysis_carterae.AAC.2